MIEVGKLDLLVDCEVSGELIWSNNPIDMHLDMLCIDLPNGVRIFAGYELLTPAKVSGYRIRVVRTDNEVIDFYTVVDVHVAAKEVSRRVHMEYDW